MLLKTFNNIVPSIVVEFAPSQINPLENRVNIPGGHWMGISLPRYDQTNMHTTVACGGKSDNGKEGAGGQLLKIWKGLLAVL